MRLFTAIPLLEQVKDQVIEIARGRLPIPYINVTNLHVTLNFFGELTDSEVEKVKSVFLETVSGHTAFEIEFESIVKHHQQLHITLKPNQDLLKLHALLEQGFVAKGFHFQDREYYPHVNLGSLHMDRVMNAQRRVENFPNEELIKLNFRAGQITLYESKLLLHHPKYTPILGYNLL